MSIRSVRYAIETFAVNYIDAQPSFFTRNSYATEAKRAIMRVALGLEGELECVCEPVEYKDLLEYVPATKWDVLKSWLPLSIQFGWLKPRIIERTHTYPVSFVVKVACQNTPIKPTSPSFFDHQIIVQKPDTTTCFYYL